MAIKNERPEKPAPPNEPEWTQIPNVLLDNLNSFTSTELQVMLIVYRKTIGWEKWRADQKPVPISITYLQNATGLSRPTVIKVMRGLISAGWITEALERGYRGVKLYMPTLKTTTSKIEGDADTTSKEDLPVEDVTSKNSLPVTSKASLPKERKGTTYLKEKETAPLQNDNDSKAKTQRDAGIAAIIHVWDKHYPHPPSEPIYIKYRKVAGDFVDLGVKSADLDAFIAELKRKDNFYANVKSLAHFYSMWRTSHDTGGNAQRDTKFDGSVEDFLKRRGRA
jgi:hypothetical protein